MDPERVTYFGETDSRGKRVKFGIKAKDRTRHVYVIGKTGMGKSTLLENMAIQDLRNGEGMAFMDPHGKTAELLLEYVPPERIKDIVYFAPFDTDHPISFNVMEDVGPDKRHLVVSGLMSAFKKLFGEESFSDRMQYILQNTIAALLEYPDATMLGINRMLTDKVYRNKVVANVTNSSVKAYWTQEFASYTERFAAEATPAIQNKIGQFTSNPLIRNIIGQPKSSFDFRKIMDEGKIMIINLSKGRVGEANANLLGSMLITKIYLAAMSRADKQEKQLAKLPNFYLYVDEFQSFANESFADILSEARKYKLNLTIAHQYIEQMSEEVRAAVFGNVGTMIVFRVGAFDAEVLEKEFMPQFTKEDLVNLGMFQMYLKLMINGVSSAPFSATSIPPYPEPVISYKKDIIENSRIQFAEMRSQVEDIINKWQDEGKIAVRVSDVPRRIGDNNNNGINHRAVDVKVHTPNTAKPLNNFSNNNNNNVTIINKTVEIPVNKKLEPKPESKPEPKLPEMEKEAGDDFLPLKEFVKKASNIPIQGVPKVPEKNKGSMELKNALADILKKTANNPESQQKEIPKEEPKKPEEKKETQAENIKEIPEKDLKNILGIEE